MYPVYPVGETIVYYQVDGSILFTIPISSTESINCHALLDDYGYVMYIKVYNGDTTTPYGSTIPRTILKRIADDIPPPSLIQSLERAYETAVSNAYYKYYRGLFENYGNVLDFNDEYVKIRVDILNFYELKNYPDLAAYTKLEDLFFDAASEDQIDKPRVNTNRINDPYPNDEDFEDNFYELCSEYNIPIKK